jgi:hypothetical protein
VEAPSEPTFDNHFGRLLKEEFQFNAIIALHHPATL